MSEGEAGGERVAGGGRGEPQGEAAAPPPPLPRRLSRGEGDRLLFGFWRSAGAPELPLPRPSEPPPPAQRAVLLRYLTAHALLESYEHGYSVCRLCGERSKALGCATLTDGVFAWPEGFAHYAAAHGVQPPRGVLEAALRAQAAGGGAQLPARNHLLWQRGGAPPEELPRGTRAWLREHSTLAL